MAERIQFGPFARYNVVLAAQHVARYSIVASYCKGKRVLDVACGEGFGSYLMARWGAAKVVAVDISHEAIRNAKALFSHKAIRYVNGDALELNKIIRAQKPFDLIVCFETIEHVIDPKLLLQQLREFWSPSGAVVISCPNDHVIDEPNEFHKAVYTFDDFIRLTTSVLGEAKQWFKGTPTLGHVNYLANSSFAERPSFDPKNAIDLQPLPKTLALPSQPGLQPSSESCSYYLGVWGTTLTPNAVITPQSYTTFVSPWREVENLQNQRSLLQAEVERLSTQHREAELAAERQNERIRTSIETGLRQQIEDAERELAETLANQAKAEIGFRQQIEGAECQLAETLANQAKAEIGFRQQIEVAERQHAEALANQSKMEIGFRQQIETAEHQRRELLASQSRTESELRTAQQALLERAQRHYDEIQSMRRRLIYHAEERTLSSEALGRVGKELATLRVKHAELAVQLELSDAQSRIFLPRMKEELAKGLAAQALSLTTAKPPNAQEYGKTVPLLFSTNTNRTDLQLAERQAAVDRSALRARIAQEIVSKERILADHSRLAGAMARAVKLHTNQEERINANARDVFQTHIAKDQQASWSDHNLRARFRRTLLAKIGITKKQDKFTPLSDRELIEASGLFDASYYADRNPDISNSGINALDHYIQMGGLEGRAPGPHFDSAFYLAQYPDVAAAKLNPLTHYIRSGAKEGRQPKAVQIERLAHDDRRLVETSGLFDAAYYIEHYPDVAPSGTDPLDHYMRIGGREGRSPGPYFDGAFYLAQNPDISDAKLNPLLHYIRAGAAEGRLPFPVRSTEQEVRRLIEASELFNAVYYAECYPDIAASGLDPLDHYIKIGALEGRSPGPHFDGAFYLAQNPDIANAKLNPLLHYIRAGAVEGRLPFPIRSTEHENRRMIEASGAFNAAHYAERYPNVPAPIEAEIFAAEDRQLIGLSGLFDAAYYTEQYPDVAVSGQDPLNHYVQFGALEGRSPSPYFDGSFYLAEYPSVAAAKLNPLAHYIRFGSKEGHHPIAVRTENQQVRDRHLVEVSGFFDAAFYMKHYSDAVGYGADPLDHYMRIGGFEGCCPGPYFNSAFYLAQYPDVALAEINPLVHYLRVGAREGRLPNLFVDPVLITLSQQPTYTNKEPSRPKLDENRFIDSRPAAGDVGTSQLSKNYSSEQIQQQERDFVTLRDDLTFDHHFYIPPSASVFNRDYAISDFLSHWASRRRPRLVEHRSYLRRPTPGFHPEIYAYENVSNYNTLDINPLAHYIRTGKPNGPWNKTLITPTSKKMAHYDKIRIALHGHFYYHELFADFLHRLQTNRNECDLFLTTDSQEKTNLLHQAARDYTRGNVTIQVVPNRGRDLGALLAAFNDSTFAAYDIVGHIHGKRSPSDQSEVNGIRWREFLWENLIGDRHPMMDAIIDNFVADKNLGLVFPCDPHLVGWSNNRSLAKSLAERIGIRTDLPPFFDFPIGGMFWARPNALSALFDLKFHWTDFPEEPIPADGTILHAIERLLPFAVLHAGYDFCTTYVPFVTR